MLQTSLARLCWAPQAASTCPSPHRPVQHSSPTSAVFTTDAVKLTLLPKHNLACPD